jgi:alcohol dehydrogenase class IV
MSHETVFTMEATPIKFGPGAVDDAGWELRRLGVTRAFLVTDPGVVAAGHVERVKRAIEREGIDVVVYDRARVEPTLDSLQDAADAALEAGVDGFVSVGGGSSMDTAKVADLVLSHPAPVMDYVNPPVGAGRHPPSPLKPHLAIPTTSGTGSEATTVAVLDLPDLKVKSGISHRYLRPAQAIVDPELTRTLPAEVTASAGLDVVCHAAESYLARPFDSRPKPATRASTASCPSAAAARWTRRRSPT